MTYFNEEIGAMKDAMQAVCIQTSRMKDAMKDKLDLIEERNKKIASHTSNISVIFENKLDLIEELRKKIASLERRLL